MAIEKNDIDSCHRNRTSKNRIGWHADSYSDGRAGKSGKFWIVRVVILFCFAILAEAFLSISFWVRTISAYTEYEIYFDIFSGFLFVKSDVLIGTAIGFAAAGALLYGTVFWKRIPDLGVKLLFPVICILAYLSGSSGWLFYVLKLRARYVYAINDFLIICGSFGALISIVYVLMNLRSLAGMEDFPEDEQ